jgi:hypothetical protein
MDGDDPLETRMNQRKSETMGVGAFLVTFWALKK